MENCSLCRFYRKIEQERGYEGCCHRHPPAPARHDDQYAVFALVIAHEWCGDYQAKH